MQVLSAAEVENQEYKESSLLGSGKGEPFYNTIDQLEVGQGLKIENSEWPYKNRPSNSSMPARIRTNGRMYRTKRLKDDNGFVIHRTN